MFSALPSIHYVVPRLTIAAVLIAGASGQMVGQYATQGLISRVAGNGFANCHVLQTDGCVGSYGGDGGPAIDAGLDTPEGVAVDGAGNVYIVDSANCRIRRVDRTTGIITTVAGGAGGTNATTVCNYNGDGIPATSAWLSLPLDVAVDATGNLYIADFQNLRIRRVDAATGMITTVAGTGAAGYNGDNIPAISANLSGPTHVALDRFGNLYITDTNNNLVRKVDSVSGIITTVAGNGYLGSDSKGGFSGDGGPATSAELGYPQGIAIDSAGNLYIADLGNERVRMVSASNNVINTIAGSGTQGYNGEGILATAAAVNNPDGIAVDRFGNVYIAEYSNDLIRRIDAVTGLISTVAGVVRAPGYNGDNIPAVQAQLNLPQGLAVDGDGNLYIVDVFNEMIRKVAAPAIRVSPNPVNFGFVNIGESSSIFSVTLNFNVTIQLGNIAVLTQSATGKDFGVAANTTCTAGTYSNGSSCVLNLVFTPIVPGLRSGTAVLYDTAIPSNVLGTIFLSGTGVKPILAFEPGLITTVAGSGSPEYSGDNGPATSAGLTPVGVGTDGANNLYIADFDSTRVRRVDAATGVITTLAGGGSGCSGQSDTLGDGCAAIDAILNSPFDVKVDFAGNVYIADYYNNLIRRVDTATNVITTFAGGGTGCDNSTGTLGDNCLATKASIATPVSIALDSHGNLYSSDSSGRIRKVDATAGIITTIAGTGVTGNFSGDGGLATNANLTAPWGLAVDAAGNVYFADYYDNRIRKIALATGIITTIAGTGTGGFSGDNGLATQAELNSPWGLTLDVAGDQYVVDRGNRVIRKIDAATGIIRTVAGGGLGCAAQTDSFGDNCAATSAAFRDPYGLHFDGAGNLFVADGASGLVRKVNMSSSAFDFPQTDVGSSSSIQTIMVSNIGNAPLSFTSLTASENFSIDSGTTTCSIASPVASGDSCQIGIIFAPTAAGSLSGDLTLTDNSLNFSGNTHLVHLSGTATGGKLPSTTSLTSSTNPATLGQTVTLTATVSATGTPTGTVAFNDGPTTLGTVGMNTSGQATYSTSSLTQGTHQITAFYSGDSQFNGSTSAALQQVILVQTAISIGNIPNSATYGGNFAPTFAYSGDGTPSVSSGTTATCTVSANMVVSFIAVGACTLTAHATAGATYAAVTGNPQSFQIAQAKPAISINNIPVNAQYAGNFVPTYAYLGDGTTSVTSSTPTTCAVANATVNFVGIGTCTLTAHANATLNSAAATGGPQSFTIAQATPSVRVNNIPNSPVYGGTFTPVYSYVGNGKTSTTSSTPNTCTISNKGVVSFVRASTCTLVAHATATTNYAAATGSPQTFSIAQASASISIKNVPNSAKRGGSFTPAYSYAGDGAPSTISNTPATCTVSGAIVNFGASGTCSLVAQATAGVNYAPSVGNAQSFTIK